MNKIKDLILDMIAQQLVELSTYSDEYQINRQWLEAIEDIDIWELVYDTEMQTDWVWPAALEVWVLIWYRDIYKLIKDL